MSDNTDNKTNYCATHMSQAKELSNLGMRIAQALLETEKQKPKAEQEPTVIEKLEALKAKRGWK